jgi:hypothetical protein
VAPWLQVRVVVLGRVLLVVLVRVVVVVVVVVLVVVVVVVAAAAVVVVVQEEAGEVGVLVLAAPLLRGRGVLVVLVAPEAAVLL